MATTSMRHSIKCPLCLTTDDQQRLLIRCLHSFCDKCIISFTTEYLENKTLHTCPLCETPFEGPDNSEQIWEWSQSLPVNHFLTNKDEKKPQPQNDNCEPCGFRGLTCKAMRFCTICKESQCQSCSSIHLSSKGSRHHCVVLIEKMGYNAERNDHIDVALLMTCSKHTKSVEYFCGGHDVFVCSKCALSDHRNCNDLMDVSTGNDVHITEDDTKWGMQQVIEHLARVYQIANEDFNRFDKDASNFKETMGKLKKTMNSIFNDYEIEYDKKFSGASQCQEKLLEELKNNHLQWTVAGENALVMYDKVHRQRNPYQIYFYGKHIEGHIDSFKNHTEQSQRMVPSLRFESAISKEVIALIKASAVGNLYICTEEYDLPKPDFKWLKLQIARRVETMTVETVDDKDSFDSPFEVGRLPSLEGVYLNSTGKVADKLKSAEVSVRVSGITFLADGRVVVTDDKIRKLFLVNPNLTRVICDTALKHSPVGVTSLSQTKLAVTVENERKILVVSVTYKLEPLWEIDTSYLPLAVCDLSENTIVVSTSTDSSCLKIVEVVIPSVKTVTEIKVNMDSAQVGRHVAVDPTGKKILISCSGAGELLCIGIDGIRLFSYKILNPGGVAVDKYGFVYVVSEKNRELHKTSQDGKCIEVLELDNSLRPNILKMNTERNRFAITFHDSPLFQVYEIETI